MKKKNLFFIVLSTLLFGSCATMYTGNKSIIHFSSEPQQANVSLNGKKVGVTPFTMKTRRSVARKMVTLEKKGYKSQSFPLEKKFVPISILSNTFIFIDLLSGAVVNYKDNFYHKTLISKANNVISGNDYNLTNNFYVITEKDTFYTSPFQDFTSKSFWDESLDKINFTLITGEPKTLPVLDIFRYKTLEIYHNGIGMGFLFFHTKIDYIIKKYIRVKYDETEKKKTFMFMEEMLDAGDYHLVKSLTDVTNFNVGTGREAGHWNTLTYYIVKEGEKILKIDQKDLLQTVKTYFSKEKELIVNLKSKNKFKVLEEYVYKDRKGADRYYNPI